MIRRPDGLPAQLADLQRTLVVGVLNVTPDSFSDGGDFLDPSAAVAHGVHLHAQGADMIDVGGESTRPGARRVAPDEEAARVLPVVRALAEAGVPVSIDTMCARTAQAAVDAGACIVNDVSGGLADPAMYPAVAALEVPYIVMHWRGLTHRLEDLAAYDDVVADVRDELDQRVRAAVAAGISPARIVVDPGLGFAKETEHNWSLLSRLDHLDELGFPILIGASRKRFLGALLCDAAGQPRPVHERDAATDAVTALAAQQGVWAVRVHDVRGSKDAVRVAAAWNSGGAADA